MKINTILIIVILLFIKNTQSQNVTNEMINSINTKLADLDQAINLTYLLCCSMILFLMQAGFAMLEAGSVTEHNSANVVFKNFLDTLVIIAIFWAVGFGFAFGEAKNKFIGANYFFGINLPNNKYDYVYWFFQFNFCAVTTTIVSGAVAGRIKFLGYIIYVIFMNILIYPLIAHWVWSGCGFLSNDKNVGIFGLGLIDFAGASVVHITSGFCGLTGAWLFGYRNQYVSAEEIDHFPPRFQKLKNGKWKVNAMQASNPILAALGVFLLWVAWYGFNCGSIFRVTTFANTAARVAINTTLTPAFSAITTTFTGLLIRFIQKKKTKWSLDDLINGIFVGMASTTGSGPVVDMWATVPIGIASGLLFIFLSWVLIKCRIDDPISVFPVHAGGGLCGIISVGLFSRQNYVIDSFPKADPSSYGLFMGGGGKRLGAQLLGALIVAAWSFVFSFALFGILAKIDMNRRKPLFTIRGKTQKLNFGGKNIRRQTVRFVTSQQLRFGIQNRNNPLGGSNMSEEIEFEDHSATNTSFNNVHNDLNNNTNYSNNSKNTNNSNNNSFNENTKNSENKNKKIKISKNKSNNDNDDSSPKSHSHSPPHHVNSLSIDFEDNKLDVNKYGKELIDS